MLEALDTELLRRKPRRVGRTRFNLVGTIWQGPLSGASLWIPAPRSHEDKLRGIGPCYLQRAEHLRN